MKKFEQLSLKGQKMRIVQDAINQIKINNFQPTSGEYLSFDNSIMSRDNLQKVIQSKENPCTCCAKGAIFASCVLNVNKVTGKHAFSSEPFIKKKLKNWFSPLELDMMEAAFEGRVITDSTDALEEIEEDIRLEDKDPTKLGLKCIKFGDRYMSDTTRLLGILKNILKNGEFKP